MVAILRQGLLVINALAMRCAAACSSKALNARPSLRQQGVPVEELVVPLEELVEQMEAEVELRQWIPGLRDFQGLVGENCFFCDLLFFVLVEHASLRLIYKLRPRKVSCQLENDLLGS